MELGSRFKVWSKEESYDYIGIDWMHFFTCTRPLYVHVSCILSISIFIVINVKINYFFFNLPLPVEPS